jgi:methanethiol S-methyltransferase
MFRLHYEGALRQKSEFHHQQNLEMASWLVSGMEIVSQIPARKRKKRNAQEIRSEEIRGKPMSLLAKTFNRDLIANHTGAVILIWILLATVPALGIMLAVFLFLGSFTIIDLGLNTKTALIWNAALSVFFFLQHSIMVRRWFKKRLGRFMQDYYHNAFYGLTSGIALAAVMFFWQKTPEVLYSVDGFMYWILRLLFVLCMAGFFWGSGALGSFDALGVKPIMRHIARRPDRPQTIVAKGPYGWSRHPLYFFIIVMIWSCPVLIADRLLFNILWTAWIVLGAYLEDRDLHAVFGEKYRQYSSQVPMLIPWKIPKDWQV